MSYGDYKSRRRSKKHSGVPELREEYDRPLEESREPYFGQPNEWDFRFFHFDGVTYVPEPLDSLVDPETGEYSSEPIYDDTPVEDFMQEAETIKAEEQEVEYQYQTHRFPDASHLTLKRELPLRDQHQISIFIVAHGAEFLKKPINLQEVDMLSFSGIVGILGACIQVPIFYPDGSQIFNDDGTPYTEPDEVVLLQKIQAYSEEHQDESPSKQMRELNKKIIPDVFKEFDSVAACITVPTKAYKNSFRIINPKLERYFQLYANHDENFARAAYGITIVSSTDPADDGFTLETTEGIYAANLNLGDERLLEHFRLKAADLDLESISRMCSLLHSITVSSAITLSELVELFRIFGYGKISIYDPSCRSIQDSESERALEIEEARFPAFVKEREHWQKPALANWRDASRKIIATMKEAKEERPYDFASAAWQVHQHQRADEDQFKHRMRQRKAIDSGKQFKKDQPILGGLYRFQLKFNGKKRDYFTLPPYDENGEVYLDRFTGKVVLDSGRPVFDIYQNEVGYIDDYGNPIVTSFPEGPLQDYAEDQGYAEEDYGDEGHDNRGYTEEDYGDEGYGTAAAEEPYRVTGLRKKKVQGYTYYVDDATNIVWDSDMSNAYRVGQTDQNDYIIFDKSGGSGTRHKRRKTYKKLQKRKTYKKRKKIRRKTNKKRRKARRKTNKK